MKFSRGNFLKEIVLIGMLAIFLSGCTLLMDLIWGKKRQPDPSPQGMYEYAMRLFQKKKYDKAAEAFKKLKEEHPLSEYTPLAELRTADSIYYDKNYAEAILLYEEFKKLHPTHPEVPYAIYQVGMCHFKQLPTLDRDQTETQKAIEQFRYLIENFPQSPRVVEGKGKMQICQRQLAEHEFYIGNFYLRTKKYKAALGRFEGLLEKFPDFGFEPRTRPLIKKCQGEIFKEEEKKKAQEAREERKKQEREKKKTQGTGATSGSNDFVNFLQGLS